MTTAGSERRGADSLIDRSVDGEELDRLSALRAVTSDNAPSYLAILGALSEAAHAYHLQMRTSEINERLRSGAFVGIEDAELRTALDQLRQWGCVDWVQDAQVRATSIDEYLRRHELWEITPAGEATLAAALAVLRAGAESGSLQQTMFRQVRATLGELETAVRADDAAGVYLHLLVLDGALSQLASNAREFYATIARIAREERLEGHVFLSYKDQLISYLRDFHEDLLRNRALIAEQFVTIDTNHREPLLRLANEGDDSGGPLSTTADWERQWSGMLGWFVSGRAERTEIDALAAATTIAIKELLTLLRRLTEQATRPINRASELRETAAWFAQCESDAAADELFDAAFGLSPVDHVGLEVPDPDSEGGFPSWWKSTPVDVPVSLRVYGRRPARGAPARRRDYSGAKELLAYQREREQRTEAVAARRLVAIDLATGHLEPDEWQVLLRWLDQVLAARPARQDFSATTQVGDTVVRLSASDQDSQLLGPGGTVVIRGCSFEVVAA